MVFWFELFYMSYQGLYSWLCCIDFDHHWPIVVHVCVILVSCRQLSHGQSYHIFFFYNDCWSPLCSYWDYYGPTTSGGSRNFHECRPTKFPQKGLHAPWPPSKSVSWQLQRINYQVRVHQRSLNYLPHMQTSIWEFTVLQVFLGGSKDRINHCIGGHCQNIELKINYIICNSWHYIYIVHWNPCK